MRILLDCRPFQKEEASSETTWFLISCIKSLAASYGVAWVFLLDKGGRDLSLPAVGEQFFYKTLPGRWGDKLWYGWLIPRAIKRSKADRVMFPDGRKVRPTKTPFCSWMVTREGLTLVCHGRSIGVLLAPDEKVRPLPPAERDQTKGAVAGGKEYFFADVSGLGASKVMDLLKAFSLFKKRQLSNMKLVLAGTGSIDKLDSYKYREDICLYPGKENNQLEGAYALIYMPRRDDPGIGVLNAWRAKVPVILLTDGPGALQEGWAGEAVVQVRSGDITSLAEALKSLYKNEDLRKGLIEKGELRVSGLDIRRSAAAIWDVLGKEMGSNHEN